MKAAFTMIPAESKRLIAKAVVEMEDIKIAKQKAYIILNGGTTNGYIAQELLGMRELEPQKFAAGTNTHRLLCVTDPDKRTPFPIILYKGEEANVRKAISIVESIKGEPSLKGFKGTCETCRYACKFAGKKAEDLPVWLNN